MAVWARMGVQWGVCPHTEGVDRPGEWGQQPQGSSQCRTVPVTGMGEGVLGQGLHLHPCLGQGMLAAVLSRGEPGFPARGQDTEKSKESEIAIG